MSLTINNEDAAGVFKDLASLLDSMLELCKLLQDDFSRLTLLLDKEKKEIEECKEYFINPMLKLIDGVSKIEESDLPRGAGGWDGMLYNNDAVSSVTKVYADDGDPLLEKVIQTDNPDGTHCVSIPDRVSRKISEHSDDIRNVIDNFVIKAKDTEKELDFDFVCRASICDIKSLLDLTFDEAKILFRMFMAQYLSSN